MGLSVCTVHRSPEIHRTRETDETAATRERGEAADVAVRAPSESAARGARWLRRIDTALETPNDSVPWREAAAIAGATYRVQARSVGVLDPPAA